MKWSKLETADQLRSIRENSKEKSVLIFKHSTSCSISRAALDRLERNWNPDEMKNVEPFFLDLLKHRDISNLVAQEFAIQHESPQVILVGNGKPVYHRSHFDINYKDLRLAAEGPAKN